MYHLGHCLKVKSISFDWSHANHYQIRQLVILTSCHDTMQRKTDLLRSELESAFLPFGFSIALSSLNTWVQKSLTRMLMRQNVTRCLWGIIPPPTNFCDLCRVRFFFLSNSSLQTNPKWSSSNYAPAMNWQYHLQVDINCEQFSTGQISLEDGEIKRTVLTFNSSTLQQADHK